MVRLLAAGMWLQPLTGFPCTGWSHMVRGARGIANDPLLTSYTHA